VRVLGADLLACLEKRDAEQLALLRAGSEKTLQDRIRALQQRAVDEANQQIDALAKTRLTAVERQNYFGGLKDQLMNFWEGASLAATAGSMIAEALAAALHTTSGAGHAVPDAQFGGSGAGG